MYDIILGSFICVGDSGKHSLSTPPLDRSTEHRVSLTVVRFPFLGPSLFLLSAGLSRNKNYCQIDYLRCVVSVLLRPEKEENDFS